MNSESVNPATQDALASNVTEPADAKPGYRWIILILAWSCYLMSSVDRFAWGSLSLRAQGELGVSLAQLGTFVTAYFVGYIASNCISGLLTDRLGPRVTLSCAVIGTGIFTSAFGITPTFWVGLALQFGMGFATGADYAACIKIVTAWFPRQLRGRALGLWFTSTSLGVVAANSAALALAGIWGWRGAYEGLGALTVVVGIVGCLLLQDGPQDVEQRPPAAQIRTLLQNRNLILVSLAGFGALWGTWGFAFSSNALMVKGVGMSQETAAAIVATFGIGGFLAKPLVGLASDWLGGRRKWPTIVSLVGFVIMLFTFGSIRSPWAFFVAGPLLGVTAFVYSPLLAALVAESVPRARTGTASGFSNALWQLGGVLVPVTVGYAFSQTQSFTISFTVLAIGPLLGILCLLGVRERQPDQAPA